MCGRYFIRDDLTLEELVALIDEANRRIRSHLLPAGIKTAGEIFPQDRVPVLTRDGARFMKWGAKRRDGGVLINSRSERLLERGLLPSSRCLVPASFYYEWENRGLQKLRYRLSPKGQDLFYMAGLFSSGEGEEYPAFSIVTREAAPDIRFIHDRMPVIVDRAKMREWLCADGPASLQTAPPPMLYTPDGPMQMSLF